MSSSRRNCLDSRVGENICKGGKVGPADTSDVDPWILQGMQQRAVPGFEEVDPPDGLAVHVARLGQAAKRTNPGREVVQSGEVGEIAPVTPEQDFTQIDQAVDALL